jgi:hypothetical protein
MDRRQTERHQPAADQGLTVASSTGGQGRPCAGKYPAYIGAFGVNSCAHWLNWKCGMNIGAVRVERLVRVYRRQNRILALE